MTPRPSKPPHLLLLIADQMTPAALPAYGHRTVHAPHIARLAAQGVVFESAYCPSPLCAPSRYGLLTGQLPSRFGGFDNASELPSELPTVAHHLRAAGYRSILAGKMHFAGPNQLHGYEERLTTDIYPADFGWTPDWDHPQQRPDWYHHMGSVLQAGPCVRTNQIDYDEEVVFAARRKLFDLARQSDGRPLFMTVSLTHPHDPYVIPQRYWDLYRDDQIELPAVRRHDVADDPHSLRLHAAIQSDITPLSDAQVRAARRAYYGAISFVDEQVGQVLDALQASGHADDTIVVLMGDHGDMLGERGLWYKMHFFEGALRVPLVVHAPRRLAAHRVRESVSTLDLLPTLLDLAGVAGAGQAAALDGRSLLPQLQGQAGADEAWAEYLGEIALAPMVMIRRGRWKYVHSPADPDLLFDLQADPHELHNLADQTEQQALVAAFRAEAQQRWDFDALHRRVLNSQRQRRLVCRAERQGRRTAWDFQPPTDASQQYVRSHLSLDDIEAMARWPAFTDQGGHA